MPRTGSGIALVAIVGLGGCVSSEDTLRAHGYSDAYVAGYHDGCPSGSSAAGSVFDHYTRDAAAYGDDDDYRTGWDFGFQTCSREFAAIEAAIAGATPTGSAGSTGVDAKKALEGIDTSGLEGFGK